MSTKWPCNPYEFGNVKAAPGNHIGTAEVAHLTYFNRLVGPVRDPHPRVRKPAVDPARVVSIVKAILCTHLGGPDDLVLADLPDPVAGAGEAVGDIKAGGLKFLHTLLIGREYHTK